MYRWYVDVDDSDRSQRRSDVDGLAFHVRRTTSFCVDESISDESDETTFSCWSVAPNTVVPRWTVVFVWFQE